MQNIHYVIITQAQEAMTQVGLDRRALSMATCVHLLINHSCAVGHRNLCYIPCNLIAICQRESEHKTRTAKCNSFPEGLLIYHWQYVTIALC